EVQAQVLLQRADIGKLAEIQREQIPLGEDSRHGAGLRHLAQAWSGAHPGVGRAGTRLSAFWARWRSAWSISTRASIASAIGAARMPTHGSWRPRVWMTVGSPAMFTERRGLRMLEVGLIASETRIGWPVEMPPSTPPARLPTKPPGVSSSP